MTLGHYSVPTGLKDEDKFLMFFTKGELVYLGITFIPCFFLCKWAIGVSTGKFICAFMAFFISFVLVGGMLVLLKIKVPEKMYLMGAGLTLFTFMTRFIRKKLMKKKIYIKNMEVREYL